MAHFSDMLSTETQPVEVTRHNISTLVTERRWYKEVPLPLVDLKGNLKDSNDDPVHELDEGEVAAMGHVNVMTLTKKVIKPKSEKGGSCTYQNSKK